MNLKKQNFFLCLHEALRGFRIAGAVWVVLLLSRGFSLMDIGVAEGVFHAVSALCEVPSGMLADLLGRKRTLMAAGLVNACSGLVMAGSLSLPGVCLAFALEAFSFNLASGTLEAISYDSLVQAGDPAEYVRWDSRQYMLYSLMQALASLGSFITVRIGFQGAYLAAAAVGLSCALAASRLCEPVVTQAQAGRMRFSLNELPHRLWRHSRESISFLQERRGLAARMFSVSLVCAAGYLMQMFWQQLLMAQGLPAEWVGIPLFILMLIDAVGAALAPRLPKSLGRLFLRLGFPLALLIAMAGVSYLPVSLAAAAAASLLESAFLVRAASLMQAYYPSDSRATMTSIDSMTYSVWMVLLSPAVGALADAAGAPACLGALGLLLAAATAAVSFVQRRCS